MEFITMFWQVMLNMIICAIIGVVFVALALPVMDTIDKKIRKIYKKLN